jgi:hypothetical protein
MSALPSLTPTNETFKSPEPPKNVLAYFQMLSFSEGFTLLICVTIQASKNSILFQADIHDNFWTLNSFFRKIKTNMFIYVSSSSRPERHLSWMDFVYSQQSRGRNIRMKRRSYLKSGTEKRNEEEEDLGSRNPCLGATIGCMSSIAHFTQTAP